MEELCISPLPDNAWSQCSLPIKLGGLGLSSSWLTSMAAFVGSVQSSLPLVRRILRDNEVSVPNFEESRNLFLLSDEDSLTQKKLSNHLHLGQFDDLFAFASTVDRARLRSQCGTHAGAWLHTVPNESLGLKFSNEAFSTLFRLHLGLQVYSCERRCPSCHSAPLDVFGHHALMCGSGGGSYSPPQYSARRNFPPLYFGRSVSTEGGTCW